MYEGSAYRDFRSTSREQHRFRKHRHRCNKFRGLDPVDLPSHLSQQSPHLPLSPDSLCSTYGTHDGHALSEIPALTSNVMWQCSQKGRHTTLRDQHGHSQNTTPASRTIRSRRNSRRMKREAYKESQDDDRFYIDMVESDLHYYMGCWMEEDTIILLRSAGVENAAALSNSRDEWIEVGETFTVWCQRRIHEMRTVKEARLRAQLQAQRARGKLNMEQPDEVSTDDEDEGYHSSTSIPTTTLPTTDNDRYGHKLIKDVLKLSPYLRRRCKWIKFPSIVGFYWFGEFEWHWHRNLTGCWTLSEYPYYPCCTAECAQWASWPDWDPEGVQRYALAEFVKGEGFRDLWRDKSDDSPMDGNTEVDDNWDVVSTSSASTAWTEVEEVGS